MTHNALLVIECNRRVSGQGSARVLKGHLVGGEVDEQEKVQSWIEGEVKGT